MTVCCVRVNESTLTWEITAKHQIQGIFLYFSMLNVNYDVKGIFKFFALQYDSVTFMFIIIKSLDLTRDRLNSIQHSVNSQTYKETQYNKVQSSHKHH